MIKILITGKDSYIGTSFEKWMSQWPDKYAISTIDVRDDSWKTHDFSNYDVILHLAAIVHVREKRKDVYFKVNTDLAYDVAQKAKSSGVSYFIFMSTMGVYGKSYGEININTKENPKSNYAKSKFRAETLIRNLQTETYKIAILRPPLVYGHSCTGNYPKLSRYFKKHYFIPKFYNIRSMIYIYNLTEFIKMLIDGKNDGIFHPQNSQYVRIHDLFLSIQKITNKKKFLVPYFGQIMKKIYFSPIQKLFGDLIYDKSISDLSLNYNVFTFEDSISHTEVE